MVLYLEKMGCDFWNDETAKSDVGNYRVRTHGECIRAKDGRLYFLEFTLWRNRQKARYTHKITGKPLKHPVMEVINPQALALDTEYSNEKGSWRNCTLEKAIHEKNLSYNKHDILTVVNEISVDTYDSIIFAPHTAIEAIPNIRKNAGWRENDVLDNLSEVTIEEASRDYLVYRYHAGERSFDYEVKSGRIVG